MKKRFRLFLILVTFCFYQNLTAQENWTLSMTGFDQTYSPTDFAVASNGDVYLSGVKYDIGISGFINKLYKSTDQGNSWAEISTTGLTDLGTVNSLIFSGSKMLIAGLHVNSANGTKIFVSDDNGSTWSLSMTGFDQTYSPTDFAVASNGDVYLSAVKYDTGISGSINKLYNSTDQGNSWTEISTTGLTDLGTVNSLIFSGSKMLIAGLHVNSANGTKIFVSDDNGSTWTLSMTGFDQTYSPADFAKASNDDIYLSAVKYDTGISGFINKLYKSTDQGNSWTEISTTGLTDLGTVNSLKFSSNKMLIAGLHVNSTNGAKIFTSDLGVGIQIDMLELIANVSCFPNPFNNQLNINISNGIDDLQFIKISSSTGKILYFSEPVLENRINTENLVSGLYFLTFVFVNRVETIKILKCN